jgi:hypothetical protein
VINIDLRKTFAIVFLTLLLLNILGYYGLFLGLMYQNDRVMTQKLDDDQYDDAETVSIKIPITIPYVTDSHDFQRVDGVFEHEGDFYRLVKQKLQLDTLHIVCVKDQQSKRINQALTDYVQTFTDKPSTEKQHTLTFSDFIKDYLTTSVSLSNLSFGWQLEAAQTTSVITFLPTYNPSIVHPPERA